MTRHARWLLLVALVATFAWAKAVFYPGLGIDGQYFYQLARHVADGDGLVTSLSLYHQGFQTFPHRVTESPGWPLLLGYAGRLVGMETAGRRLPELLFLIDLVLLYALAWRIQRRILGPAPLHSRVPSIDLGHLSVLLFGCNTVFFRFTSLPYTEAMAFATLLSALLCVDRASDSPRAWGWAVGAGVFAGITLLTRGQMLAVAATVPAVFAWVGVREPRFRVLAGASLLGTAAVLLPWVVYLSTWMPRVTLTAALGFATLRETPSLENFDAFVSTATWSEHLIDRGRGLLVAFDPDSGQSFVRSFGWPALAVPLAGAAALVHAGIRWRSLRWWLEPRDVTLAATLLTGLALLGPVFLAHLDALREWLFGHRHGLPLVLLLVPALAYLLALARGPLRALALAVLVALLGLAVRELHIDFDDYQKQFVREWEWELIEWLDAHEPTPVVVTPKFKTLAPHSRSYFHWTECDQPGETTVRLLRDARADYVIAFARDAHCPYIVQARPQLWLVRTFGVPSKVMVFRLAGRTPRTWPDQKE